MSLCIILLTGAVTTGADESAADGGRVLCSSSFGGVSGTSAGVGLTM